MHELNQQLNTLEDNMRTQDKSKKKIILKTFDNIHLVKLMTLFIVNRRTITQIFIY